MKEITLLQYSLLTTSSSLGWDVTWYIPTSPILCWWPQVNKFTSVLTMACPENCPSQHFALSSSAYVFVSLSCAIFYVLERMKSEHVILSSLTMRLCINCHLCISRHPFSTEASLSKTDSYTKWTALLPPHWTLWYSFPATGICFPISFLLSFSILLPFASCPLSRHRNQKILINIKLFL